MFFLHIFSAYIVFGRITRYLHPLFLHSSYFRTRESFPLVSFPSFFHSASYSSFFPRMCIIFIDVIIAFLFSRVDFPYLCVTRVHARARMWDRKKGCARIRVCMLCVCESIPDCFCDCVAIYMHSYVSYVYHYVCVFQSWLVTEKREGRSGGKSKEEVFVYRCICVFPSFVFMYVYLIWSVFVFLLLYIHTYIYIYMHTDIYTYIHTCIRLWMYVHICTFVCTHSCSFTKIYKRECLCIHIYVHIYL